MTEQSSCNGNCIGCALHKGEDPNKKKTLRDLKISQSAIIKEVGGTGSLRQHFLDMGVIPEAQVTLIK